MSAVFSYDAQTGPQYVDLNGIAAGYGVISVPVDGFLPGDVVQTVGLTITGTGLATIQIAIDMVMRTGGYYEWTAADAINAHFTMTPTQIAAIAAATNCQYSLVIMVLRNGVQQVREVQAGSVSARAASPTPPLVVNSIAITGGPVTGNVGSQTQLTAAAYDGFGNALPSATITWTSSNTNVATVDATGKVTLILPGTSTITASSQGIATSTSATCNDAGFVGATDKQVAAYSAAQSKWIPATLVASYVSATAGSLIVGGGWPTGATELAPGAAAGYVRSNGSAWVRSAGVPASDITAGTFGAGAYVFPSSLTVSSGFTVSAGTSALQAVTATTVNASGTITGAALSGSLTNTLTFGTHLTSGGASFNNSASVTISTDATNLNTASTIVARDASGNFSAGTITATLNGAAPAGSLTGTTLASNVVTSSLTTVGVLASPHMTSPTVDSGGLTVTAGGVTVSAGTTAVQALTATTGVFSSSVSAVGLAVTLTTVNTGATISNATAAQDSSSLPLWLSAKNTAGTLTNVSIEVQPQASASADFVVRTGGTGANAFGTTALTIKGSNQTATFAQALTVAAGGLTVTAGGLTVSAGTSALQAVTATTIAATSTINTSSATGYQLQASTVLSVSSGNVTLASGGFTGITLGSGACTSVFSNGTLQTSGNANIGGTPDTNVALHISRAQTAAGTFAAGIYCNPNLNAAANNDALFGHWINITPNPGAFTGTSAVGLKISNVSGAASNYAISTGLGSILFGDTVSIGGGGLGSNTMFDLSKNLTASSGAAYNVHSNNQLTAAATSDQLISYIDTTLFVFNAQTGLTGYGHWVNQSSTGTGSMSTYYGVRVQSTSVTATTKYAFYADSLPSYFGGPIGTGANQPDNRYGLNFATSVTAVAGIAASIRASGTITASANGDVLAGLFVSPTFSVGGFTGTFGYGLRIAAITGAANNIAIETNGGTHTLGGAVTISSGGLTVTAGGLTVSAGTTAVQALTATSGSFTSTVGVGGAPNTASALRVSGSLTTFAGSQFGISSDTTVSSAATQGAGVYANISTAAAAFTLTSAFGLYVDVGAKGAGSTITTQYGLYVSNQALAGTNYAIYTNTGAVSFGDTVTIRANGLTVSSGTTAVQALTCTSLTTTLDINVGNGAKIWIQNMTAPGSNPTAGFYIYSDVADGKLKARSANGTVTILATL